MNIVEQRYDFLVDMESLPKLDTVMLERLLYKNYRHKGWLLNYLFHALNLDDYNSEQQVILKRCALELFNRELL